MGTRAYDWHPPLLCRLHDRNYHEQKERELSAVSDQISAILTSIVADAAAPLPHHNGSASRLSAMASSGLKRGVQESSQKENIKLQKTDNLNFQVGLMTRPLASTLHVW